MSVMVPILEHKEKACVGDSVRSVRVQIRPSDHLIVAEDTDGNSHKARARIPVLCRGFFPSMQIGADFGRQRVDGTETFGDRYDLSARLQVSKSEKASISGVDPTEVATDRSLQGRCLPH